MQMQLFQDTSEWVHSWQHISTIRLYSAIHLGSHWKNQDRKQIKNTDKTETRHKLEKSKQRKTKLHWFSCLLRHLAGNEVGLFYNAPDPTRGITCRTANNYVTHIYRAV